MGTAEEVADVVTFTRYAGQLRERMRDPSTFSGMFG
jgi:hypothetical protein